MRRLLVGSLAGLAATVPMTAAMVWMHRRLPEDEQYPLPPRRVTMNVAEAAGVVEEEEQLRESEKRAMTLAAHFAYGAGAGALYGPLARQVPLPPVVSGAAYGLAVWAGSYLGWLPAAGLLAPATEHPARRTALMIAAHLVWGASAGALVGLLDEGRGKK
ncbi:MAG TPA: DUF1440 domain-containing protein [Pyrinomonadaceae bacterium]|nr:DUF1440 domain-containing protein [Pyrinomonadaceae bacterium]